jgi:hypothetical protein
MASNHPERTSPRHPIHSAIQPEQMMGAPGWETRLDNEGDMSEDRDPPPKDNEAVLVSIGEFAQDEDLRHKQKKLPPATPTSPPQMPNPAEGDPQPSSLAPKYDAPPGEPPFTESEQETIDDLVENRAILSEIYACLESSADSSANSSADKLWDIYAMSRILKEREGTATPGYSSADDPRSQQVPTSSTREPPNHLTTLLRYANATTTTHSLFIGRKPKSRNVRSGSGSQAEGPDAPAPMAAPAKTTDPRPPAQEPPARRHRTANIPSCRAGLKPEYQGMPYGGIEGFKLNGGPAFTDPVQDFNNALSQIFQDHIPPNLLLSSRPSPRSRTQAACQTDRAPESMDGSQAPPEPVPQHVSATPEPVDSSDDSDSIDHLD